MTLLVQQIEKKDWESFEEISHAICFGEMRPAKLNKHHFVLGVFKDSELSGYMTCIEMDSETAYIQYGGSFPNYEKTIYVLPAYFKFIQWFRERYKRVTTRIENTNKAMLKMALQMGFVVNGIYVFKDKTFLELINEF